MIQTLIGRKIDQTQGFLEDGTRVPLSIISVGGNVVTQIKSSDREGYNSIQLGFGNAKRPTKPMAGHIKKAGLKEKMPRFFREARADEAPNLALGSAISVLEVLVPGDVVDVTGTSKGKGFAGVVKRHHFRGGPRTHGQSDRERAPGSIGQTTTPGRVYKGKRMAGKMGNERVTIKNLEVLDVKEDTLLVRGLIPGAKGSIVTITKVGKNKKFKPLWMENREQRTENGEQPPLPETSASQGETEDSSQMTEGQIDIKTGNREAIEEVKSANSATQETQSVSVSEDQKKIEKPVTTEVAEIKTEDAEKRGGNNG